jgi:DNA replication protein DnaC
MTNESTINKLIEMRLTAMADAFRIQKDDPSMKGVPFDDRLGMLVDIEYTSRKNNRLKRLIRKAEFEQPDASVAAIDYHSGRKLNKALIERMSNCEYITEYRNIFITGATGSGKTYMACAFGMEACKQFYTVQYVRLPDLLLDLQAARDNGNFPAALKKYTKPVLLIIDEWLLLKLTEPEARNLFELIHKRRKKSSTIFCSQFREEEWYQQICGGESTLADAIMDRISYDSYKIDIESADPSKDISMREVYGLDPKKAR